MTTPSPPSIFTDLEEIRRRLRVQESANRQANGGISGGAIIAYDSAGNFIAFMGDNGNGAVGMEADLPAGGGMLSVTDLYGWAMPYLGTSWVKATDNATTTSGTFVDLWRARIEQATGVHFRFTIYFLVPAGSTGEVRVTLNTVAYAPVYSLPDGHAGWHQWSYPLGGSLYAGPYELAIQARVTSGAGPITLYNPYDLHQGYFIPAIPVTGWIS
jgi:hypothetical protein